MKLCVLTLNKFYTVLKFKFIHLEEIPIEIFIGQVPFKPLLKQVPLKYKEEIPLESRSF